jgi:3-methyladenine DNA glycosylase AlkD
LFQKELIFDWNVCDWLCIRVLGPLIEANGGAAARAVSVWKSASNLWQARASVVAFVPLTNIPEFQPLWLEACSVIIRREERFAKTGVGWILRELSKSNEEQMLRFIHAHIRWLSKESLNNAIKYLDPQEKKRLQHLIRDTA